MIRINQLKLPIESGEAEIRKKAGKLLRLEPKDMLGFKIARQSLDARKKDQLLYSYCVEIKARDEAGIVKRAKNANILLAEETSYQFPSSHGEALKNRPVVIGSGPAGLFCALMLARHGFAPVLLERGDDVETRQKKVECFWNTGLLDTQSNVQFGEGGAGTFSDGKLNTLVKDPGGRNLEVLRLLAEAGADPEILYQSKPHIGTDVLSRVVKNIRQQLIDAGGEVHFRSQVTRLIVEGGRIEGVEINGKEVKSAGVVVLAIGHSARDTFQMLERQGVHMERKAFAVGLRIQHPQNLINLSQYGLEEPGSLGAASYKLTAKAPNGRGVYSFCMCPGGYVVNASSEQGHLAVNGMSNHNRAGANANSALIVTVSPEDYGKEGALSGVEFQRRLEASAYLAGDGAIPIQLYGDFKQDRESLSCGQVEPQTKGRAAFANLRRCLPEYLSTSLISGMESFERQIPGFGRYDAVLAGVESRTSSPVRIVRDESFESCLKGLYPCGEGAGYAGGITSAAMDGLRVAEAIAKRYGASSID